MAVQGSGGGKEDVYATLLLTDTYLPGALVLAHSLRDAATTKKLVALVTLDSVSAGAITELKSVYDYVIPVPRIRNAQPANLQLMNRTDLHSAFTKINLWSQTQFRKIVYIDADVVAYRAPDELFDISHPFSAAPDIGWPDLFNTGVMVLTPNLGDYYAMMAMAERGISFDGADQGLINTHFRNNYNRISFTYNVTPSAHYQYIPAYRHFQSSINMVHFIGSDKPWFKGRHASIGNSPFDEMTGRWWSVYDRHYRAPSPHLTSSASGQPSGAATATARSIPELVQSLTKGEYQPKSSHIEPSSRQHGDELPDYGHFGAPPTAQSQVQHYHHDAPGSAVHSQHQPQYHDAHNYVSSSQPGIGQQPPGSDFSSAISSSGNNQGSQAQAGRERIHQQGFPPVSPKEEQKPAQFEPSTSSWDAQRQPPPAVSQPEAINFPATVYEMSKDTAPFIPPRQYPSPPKGMWYEVPKEAPAAPSEPPKPIFPWEANRPKPSRIFVDDTSQFPQRMGKLDIGASGKKQPGVETDAEVESSMTETPPSETKSEPVTPITPTIQISLADPWSSYSRSNAWDDIPEIERYVDKRRRSMSLKSPGTIALPSPGDGIEGLARPRRGSKLTDFPTELERPSLPVTPAPVHRTNFWGDGAGTGQGGNNPPLPSAAGVPGQSDWDPVAQLEKLAAQHSELLKKLGSSGDQDSSELPLRPAPSHSEELVSPTYVVQSAQVLSPQPVKGSANSSSVLGLVADEEDLSPRTTPLVTEGTEPDGPEAASEGSNSE